MVKAGKRTRKAGRPTGSRNTEHPVVDVPMPTCTECNCTEFRVLKRLPDVVHSGLRGSQPYTRIEFRRVQCLQCNNVQMHRCYTNGAGTSEEN